MEREANPQPVTIVLPQRRQTVLWIIAILLAIIATTLVVRGKDLLSPPAAFAEPPMAGARGVFAFTGQRFVPDGWGLSRVTFDRVLWKEDLPVLTWYKKVLRRYPSALDVAFGILGNSAAGDFIAERMLNRSGMTFRDRYPYAHNLTALAATFDRVAPEAWQESIYTRWLGALRQLSPPTTDARWPQAMRTQAWARRTLPSSGRSL